MKGKEKRSFINTCRGWDQNKNEWYTFGENGHSQNSVQGFLNFDIIFAFSVVVIYFDTMDKAKNNFAFIDSQNLNLGIRSQSWILDYKRFRVYLADKYHVSKAFLFIGYIPQNQDLYTALQKDGYLLVFKPTLLLPSGRVKGNVDAELVLHTMIEYDHFNQAVVVTGDGDFFCLIDYLMKKDKLKKLLVPNRYEFSSLYRKHMSHIHFLTGLQEKLGHKKRSITEG